MSFEHEKLTSRDNKSNYQIPKYLPNVFGLLRYVNYYSISAEYNPIHLLVTIKVNGRIKSIGVLEDRWHDENTLHLLILNDNYARKEDVVIPILDTENTLHRIDIILYNRLLQI